MATYYLFLDELKPNDIYKHFCLGGCIIEDMTYRNNVIPFVNNLKAEVFGDTTTILHESTIRAKKDKEYRVFKKVEVEQRFWNGLKELLTKDWIHTMCVGINYEQYKNVYKIKSKCNNSEYFIALQIILENFVHFLEEKDGKGAVYIESRGIDDDQELENQYNTIKRNGTLFVDNGVFAKRLKTISFPMKADNNIGIQLADFVPNPVARHFDGSNQREINIFTEVSSRLYDGNLSLTNRFGIKKIL